jgi:hypothetical protein
VTGSRANSLVRRYRDSAIFSLVLMICVVYPNIAMYFNRPPSEGQTETLRGVILHAQRQHPNIVLLMPNGSEQALDFPGDLQGIYMAKWTTFSGASAEEFRSLVGCKADIQIDRLRGVLIPTNPRIWSLRCDRVSVSYTQIIKHYNNGGNMGSFRWILIVGSLSVLLILIYGDFIQGRK